MKSTLGAVEGDVEAGAEVVELVREVVSPRRRLQRGRLLVRRPGPVPVVEVRDRPAALRQLHGPRAALQRRVRGPLAALRAEKSHKARLLVGKLPQVELLEEKLRKVALDRAARLG